jgi:hypothetical protein
MAMKKLISLFTALFIFCHSYSQTEKGKKMLGAVIDLSNSSKNNFEPLTEIENNDDETSFQINPRLGFFIKDKFEIGASLNFEMDNSTYETINHLDRDLNYTNENNITTYGLGAFARSYVSISEKFSFIVTGSVMYDYTERKSNLTGPLIDAGESVDKINSINIIITPGINYFLNTRWGLEASFGNLYYTYFKSKGDDNDATF